MMTPADLLPRVVDIVLESSEELLRAYRSGAGREVIRLKDAAPDPDKRGWYVGGKPVTRADVREAEFYAAALSCLLPEAFFVSAELVQEGSGGEGLVPPKAGWFVDPIDGTRGFVEGNGEWVTSVGLAIDGRPVLGVIAQPTLGRIWTAVAGGHARESYYDDRSRAGSRVLERGPDEEGGELVRALLVRSRSHRTREGWHPAVEAVDERCSVTEIGSAALKMMMVARGDAHLFVGKGSAWDTCAGEVILRAACWSSVVGSFDAEPLDYSLAARKHPRGVIASVDPRTYCEAWMAIVTREHELSGDLPRLPHGPLDRRNPGVYRHLVLEQRDPATLALEKYNAVVVELLAHRATMPSGALSDAEEARFAGALETYWHHLTEDERAEADPGSSGSKPEGSPG